MVIFPFLCKKKPEGTSDRTTIWIRQQGISSGELDANRSDPWLCTWQQDGPRIRTTQSLACRDNLDSGDSLGQPGCIPHNMSQECRKNAARNGSVYQLLARKCQKSINRQICWPSMTCQSPISQAHVQAMQAAQAGTRQVELGEIWWNKPGRRRQSGWIIILVPGTSLDWQTMISFQKTRLLRNGSEKNNPEGYTR